MTRMLRDRLAEVLGPGNDDATAYRQADAVLDILREEGHRAARGGAFDRDKALDVLSDLLLDELDATLATRRVEPYLDRLAECVTEGPLLIRCARCGRQMLSEGDDNTPENDAMDVCSTCQREIASQAAAARLAVDGVILTREEAALAAWALREVRGWPLSLYGNWDGLIAHSHSRDALAARLEREAGQ